MVKLDVSCDTQEFEVPAELDKNGNLTRGCARQICQVLDSSGFVVIPRLLSDQMAAVGLQIVCDSIADPNREMGNFASQTDLHYGRLARHAGIAAEIYCGLITLNRQLVSKNKNKKTCLN